MPIVNINPFLNYSFDDDIIRIVKMLSRSYDRVFPFMVIPHLQLGRAEGSLRRDMARLAHEGRLIRVGGFNARKGYRVPTMKRKPIQFPVWRSTIA